MHVFDCCSWLEQVKEVCVAGVTGIKSKPALTFGSWLAVRVASAGCVGDICLSVADLFLLNPSSAVSMFTIPVVAFSRAGFQDPHLIDRVALISPIMVRK